MTALLTVILQALLSDLAQPGPRSRVLGYAVHGGDGASASLVASHVSQYFTGTTEEFRVKFQEASWALDQNPDLVVLDDLKTGLESSLERWAIERILKICKIVEDGKVG